jgi:hypothetical protein
MISTNTFQLAAGALYIEQLLAEHSFTANVINEGRFEIHGQVNFRHRSVSQRNGSQPAAYVLGSAAQLLFEGNNHLVSDTEFSGQGFFRVQSTTLTVRDTVDVNNLAMVDSTLSGDGRLNVKRAFGQVGDGEWTGGGTLDVNPNAFADIEAAFADTVRWRLINRGTTTFRPGDDFYLGSGMDMTNHGILIISEPSALLDGAIGGEPRARLQNHGTLVVNTPDNPDGTASLTTVAIPFTNAGTLYLQRGVLECELDVNQTAGETTVAGGLFRTRGRFTVQADSRLSGTGSIQAVEVVNAGTVSVGRDANPRGSLQIFGLIGVADSGNYTQLNTGTLDLRIFDTPPTGQFNRLIIGGRARLGGTLTVTVVSPHAVAGGDTYGLVTWNTLDPVQNRFTTTPAGWIPLYEAAGLRLRRFNVAIPRARFWFANTLSSDIAGAPDLISVDPLGRNAFETAVVYGQPRRVFHFDGDADPVDLQAGLSLNVTGLIPYDDYSVEMVFEFLEESGYRRILDVKDRQSDDGFYVNPDHVLQVYPAKSGLSPFTANVFHHVVLTNSFGEVTVYLNGMRELTIEKTTLMNLESPSGLMHFFLDNLFGLGLGEYSDGRIALMEVYEGLLSEDEVALRAQDPFADLAAPVFSGPSKSNGGGRFVPTVDFMSELIRPSLLLAPFTPEYRATIAAFAEDVQPDNGPPRAEAMRLSQSAPAPSFTGLPDIVLADLLAVSSSPAQLTQLILTQAKI